MYKTYKELNSRDHTKKKWLECIQCQRQLLVQKQLSAVSKQHELVTIMGSFWSVCGARGSARRYELCRRSVGISFTLQTCTLLRDEGQALLLSPGKKSALNHFLLQGMHENMFSKEKPQVPSNFLQTLLSGPRVLMEEGTYTGWIFKREHFFTNLKRHKMFCFA